MNEKIELGVINSLRVNRVSEPGVYLIAGDEEEVLLPNCYVTKEMEIDSIGIKCCCGNKSCWTYSCNRIINYSNLFS